MGELVEIITPLHTRTSRDYLARMVDDKVHCSEVARQYGADYWDGDRRYGYGGYRYDGRWEPLRVPWLSAIILKAVCVFWMWAVARPICSMS
ncbi:hypothetical protein [Roseovarius pacificus]|uniref:hypothetical protein n=1 Tax=Roseovarius pacificus TaxID=337701 RepID=UPI002A18DDE4|nr:hypothetical protein [Roseovarius pacificus]